MLALLRHLHRAKELVQWRNPVLQLQRKQGFYKRNGPGENYRGRQPAMEFLLGLRGQCKHRGGKTYSEATTLFLTHGELVR